MVRVVKKFVERRADIVKAARQLFSTKEYEKTTMQDVMDALGIAKGTIYHYFKSKDELLEAVIEDIVEENIQRMRTAMKETKGNALEKMKLLVKTGSTPADNKNILDYLHKPANYAVHSRLLAAILIKQAPLYAEVIQQGCKEGVFKTESPLECAEFILSAVQFLTDVGIYPWAQEDLLRRVKAFPKLIEQQLMAPRGSMQFLAEQIEGNSKEELIKDYENVEVKKSTIGQFEDGLGTFAKRAFKKGEIVIKWNLVALSKERFNHLSEYEKENFCHKRNGIQWLYPDPERHVNRFKHPNVAPDFEKQANIALRNINKGEELSIADTAVEDF